MKRDRKYITEARQKLLHGIGVPAPSPFRPDPFQLQAIESLSAGKDTLVIAPTGSGKTYIAIEAVKRILAEGKRAIYTAPLKALSNTKYAEFKKMFEPAFTVGLLTGDRKIDTDANLVVATTEIYRNDLYGYSENYTLVVLDELHYLADVQRGPVWEESIILSPPTATLLMLSASISNPHDVAAWIGSIRNREVTTIVEKERPVELRLAFFHPEHGVVPLADEKGRLFPEVAHFYGEKGETEEGTSEPGRRRPRGRGEVRGRPRRRRRRG